jgi:RNA polymerase sigma factor (sigma-70 family)
MGAMSSSQFVSVLRYVRRLVEGSESAQSSDRQLLARYVVHRDEDAFAAIVQRHGTLVWGVCRRVLDDPNDADDAFQAAFLVLLNRATALRGRDCLAGWLQGVAWRLARKVKVEAARRKAKEAHPKTSTTSDASEAVIQRDVRQVLDEELDRLPEKYRVPLILCYLEGKTYNEAARLLGWPDGTVCGRLARARELLRQRLTRRGLTLSIAALTATSVEPLAAPATAVAAVGRMARAYLLSQPVAGTSSTAVVGLARGLLETMALSKLRVGAFGLALFCVCAASAGWVTQRAGKATPAQEEPPAEAPRHILNAPQPNPGAAPEIRKDFYGDPLPPGVLARMGSSQFRHTRADIVFSKDGKRLISAGSDLFVNHWDLNSGKAALVTRLPRPESDLQRRFAAMRLSPDGTTLAVVSWGVLHLYDTATGSETRRFEAEGDSDCALAFSANGKCLACTVRTEKSATVKLWNLATGTERTTLDAYATAMTFSADGAVLATLQPQLIRLWDTTTGRLLGQKQSEEFKECALSPDGKVLAIATWTGTVRLLEVPSFKELCVFASKPRFQVESSGRTTLTFSPDGSYLALGGLESLIVWNVAERSEKLRILDGRAHRIIFTRDNKTLAVAGESMIRRWDLATGKELYGRVGHDYDARVLAMSPDGKTLASIDFYGTSLQLWDTTSGRPLLSIPYSPNGLRDCSFASNDTLSISTMNGRLELLDAHSGKVLQQIVVKDIPNDRSRYQIFVSHLSKNGKRLAAISQKLEDDRWGQDRLTVWDTTTGKEIARRPFSGDLFTASFTPDGMTVSAGNKGRFSLQETMTGKERLVLSGDHGHPVIFSPLGDLAAVGINKTTVEGSWQNLGIRVFEVSTGEELFHADGRIGYASFSADGRLLATASDNALQVWDALTGAKLFHLQWPAELVPESPSSAVYSIVLTPDGHAAVTGMNDGTILAWDLTAAAKPSSPIRSTKLEKQDLEKLWSGLTGDAKLAQSSLRTLVAAHDQAVSFLAGKLKPVAVIDPTRLANLVADLDAKEFSIREKAARELSQIGEQIEPDLRHVLDGKPTPEVRNRVEAVLANLQAARQPQGEKRRTLRAIQALRVIGTTDAHRVLQKLADGAPNARETKVAQEALLHGVR